MSKPAPEQIAKKMEWDAYHAVLRELQRREMAALTKNHLPPSKAHRRQFKRGIRP